MWVWTFCVWWWVIVFGGCGGGRGPCNGERLVDRMVELLVRELLRVCRRSGRGVGACTVLWRLFVVWMEGMEDGWWGTRGVHGAKTRGYGTFTFPPLSLELYTV